MAVPVHFKFANLLLKGKGEIGDLLVFTDDEPEKNVVSCWELSDDEMMDIVRTRKIYVHTITFGKPILPFGLSTECPIKEIEIDNNDLNLTENG